MNGIFLYRVSNEGILGNIEGMHDFGSGLYMYSDPDLAKSLAYRSKGPHFYVVRLNIENIPKDKILDLQGEEWLYYILYNRKRLESIKGSPFYNKYKHLGDGKHLIIGKIADTTINDVIKRFVGGEITDKVLYESIHAIDSGTQYVAKTKEAYKCIEVISERLLYGTELENAKWLAKEKRRKGAEVAREMLLKYRREGSFMDEVIIQDNGILSK